MEREKMFMYTHKKRNRVQQLIKFNSIYMKFQF
jgi:hypothetical protein